MPSLFRSRLLMATLACALLLCAPASRAALVNTSDGSAFTTPLFTTSFTLIPFDDLIIPIPLYTPFTLTDGKVTQADFNGDGRLDLLIRPLTSSGTTYLFHADAQGKYNMIAQQWTGNYLGVNWGADQTTLYIGDYDDDGRADLIVETTVPGGQSGLFYSTANGTFTALEMAWGYIAPSTPPAAPVAENPASTPGTTVGAFEVSPRGSATYTIPLTLPPGIAGLTPELALRYDSQGGNDLLGMGWSLEGLPVLHRCAANVVQDSYADAVFYGVGDRLCLNGQRLVIYGNISAGYWAATEYRTEVDGYTRIVKNSAGTGYLAYLKSGQILEFGTTPDAVIEATGSATNTDVRVWALNKIRDRKNNHINISYSETNATGEYYPDTLTYAGGQILIKFGYESRSDPIEAYVGGKVVRTKQRLKTISVHAGTTVTAPLARHYALSYSMGTATGRSRLTTLQECAGTTTRCRAATTLAWSDTTTHFQSLTPWHSALSTGRRELGDFNGDGKTDLLVFSGDSALMYAATGSGFANGVTWGLGYTSPSPAGSVPPSNWWVSDVDGDGKSDIVSIHSNPFPTSGPLPYSKIWYGQDLASNSNTTGKGIQISGYSNPAGFKTTTFYSAVPRGGVAVDLDGDGCQDLLAAMPVYDYDSTTTSTNTYDGRGRKLVGSDWYTLISPCNAVSPLAANLLAPANDYTSFDTRYTGVPFTASGDFDGDGDIDLLGTKVWFNNGGSFTASTIAPPAGNIIGFADFNGDGKADVLTLNGGTASVALSTGSAFLTSTAWASGVVNTNPRLGDFNNDGKTDLADFAAGKAILWLSSGTDFRKIDTSQTQNTSFDLLADVNGDGRPDIVSFADNVVNVALATAQPSDVLTTITDGQGAKIAIDYTLTTKNRLAAAGASTSLVVYRAPTYTAQTRGGTSPNPVFKPNEPAVPLTVVQKVTYTDVGTRVTSYNYGALKIERKGRGLLGFDTLSHIDHRAITTTRGYLTSYPYTGRLARETRTYTDATSTLRTLFNATYTWSQTASCTAPCGNITTAQAVFLSASSETRNDLLGKLLATTSYTANPSNFTALTGNLSADTTQTSNGSATYVTSSDYTYHLAPSDATLANWHRVGLLKTRTTLSTPTRAWADSYNQGPSTRKTSYDYYTDSGLLKTVTLEPDNAALTQTTVYDYDSFGNAKTTILSGAGLTPARVSTVDYGADGRYPRTLTNALGHRENRDNYDPRIGQPQKITDLNGLITQRAYDDFGRLSKEIRPDGTERHSRYALCSALTTCASGENYALTTTASGAPTVTVYYDLLGREIRRTTAGFDGTLITQTYTYDSWGRLTGTTAPYYPTDAVYTTTTDYDLFDRPLKQTVPAPDLGATATRVIRWSYDGLATTTTNPRGHSTLTLNNALGQLIQTQDAQGHLTHYDYDPYGNLRYRKDAQGHILTQNFDARGRRTQLDDPDQGRWTYGYNGLSELTKITDAQGQTTTHTYDVLGRLTTRTLHGSATPDHRWTYDTAPGKGKGQLAVLTGQNGYKRIHTYDTLGRLIRRATRIAGVTYNHDTGYDAYSRPQTQAYPATTPGVRLTLAQSYTASGYLKDLKNATTGTLYWQATAHNAHGQITQETLGNGLITQRTYHPLDGWLDTLKTGPSAAPTTIQNLDYSWDANGNLQTRADLAAGLSETYSYDNLNRLTGVTGPSPKSYAYDSLGNLKQKSDFGDTYRYPGDLATPQISIPGTPTRPHAVREVRQGGPTGTLLASYTYDPNGRLLSGQGRSYTYTYDNHPQTITQGTLTTTFDYDPDGTRTRARTTAGTTIYLNPRWDLGANYEKTTTANGTVTHRHTLNAGNRPIALITTTPTGTTTRYLHTDHLGSLVALTSDTGTLVQRLSYDPWGKRRHPNGTDATTPLTSPTTPHGYTGHEMLDSHGLIHMNARLYDPLLGRFLQADPIGFAGGDNLYSYADNTPINQTDLSGLSPYDPNQTSPSGRNGLPPSYYSGGLGGPQRPYAAGSSSSDVPLALLSGVAVGVAGGVVTTYALSALTAACFPCGLTASGALLAFGGYSLARDDFASARTIGTSLQAVATGRANADEAFLAGSVFGGLSGAPLGGTLRAGIAKSGSEPTILYRAVGPSELADIQSTGVLRNLGSAEGKYFTTSAEAASSYAKQAVKGFGDPPYTLIQTQVPKSIFEGLSPATVDRGIPAWVVPNERLQGLSPEVLNWMSIPK